MPFPRIRQASVAAVLVASALLASCVDSTAEPTRRAPSVAIRVIDGDTFAVGRQRFRLRGVDTPERGAPRWLLAARRLDALLRAGPLTVVRHGEDVYGRTLVDVYVGTHDVAALLRREGFDTGAHRRRR